MNAVYECLVASCSIDLVLLNKRTLFLIILRRYCRFQDCHPEHLITESKFLREESLQELMKSLTFASQGPEATDSLGVPYEEEAAVFNLELLIRVVLENR